MSKKTKSGKNVTANKVNNKGWIFAVIAVLVVVVGIFAATIPGMSEEKVAEKVEEKSTDGIMTDAGLQILKSEITSTVKFYPFEIDKVKMEVMVVKASDGTIRTALNTCQVCYSSGRGYYKQVGNEVICQNCGNRFKIDQIELVKGGCNPVPILKANKTENETHITISKEHLAKNKFLFLKWKR